MATDEELLQAELQSIFMEGAPGIVEEFEQKLLELETTSDPKETLASIFRAAHSLKGSAASVGFTGLAAFAHKAEDCLSILRNHPGLLSKDVVSSLLQALDIMKAWIDGLKEKGSAFGEPEGVGAIVILLQDTTSRLADAVSGEKKESPGNPATPTGLNTPPAAAKGTKIKSSNTIKVDSERVDLVMDLVGELVVIKSQLLQDSAIKDLGSARVEGVLSLLDKTVRELYDKALSMRMTSLKSLFLKVERAVRDTSVKVGKDVVMETDGEDTELDRAIIEHLGDPLMHLARNAVDHGIEDAEARFEGNKPAIGQLRLAAGNRGSNVIIEISDDGRGLDPAKIAKKAVEKGLVDKTAITNLRPEEINKFLFLPGFSTAEKVTDVSGRGVGLDVVKTAVENLKGKIEIDSTPGRGTVFRLVLPLTTAILDGVIVTIGGHRYILPMDVISEFVNLCPGMLTGVDTGEVLNLRESFIPSIRMARQLGFKAGPEQLAIIVNSGGNRVAFIVDDVVQQSQVVLKNLNTGPEETHGVSGAAILGDGRVALVLDPAAITQDF